MAAESGHVEMVKLLLYTKAVRPRYVGREVLVDAAEEDHLEVVQLLSGIDGMNILEAFTLAAWKGHVDLACKKGELDVIALMPGTPGLNPFEDSNCALRNATELYMVKILLMLPEVTETPGISASINGNKGLPFSFEFGHSALVKELLRNLFVNLSYQDNAAIVIAAKYGDGVGVNPSDGSNQAFRLATAAGHVEVALGTACEKGFLPIVKALLTTGNVDPAARQNEALRVASEQGHLEIVKLLLETDLADATAVSNEAVRMGSCQRPKALSAFSYPIFPVGSRWMCESGEGLKGDMRKGEKILGESYADMPRWKGLTNGKGRNRGTIVNPRTEVYPDHLQNDLVVSILPPNLQPPSQHLLSTPGPAIDKKLQLHPENIQIHLGKKPHQETIKPSQPSTNPAQPSYEYYNSTFIKHPPPFPSPDPAYRTDTPTTFKESIDQTTQEVQHKEQQLANEIKEAAAEDEAEIVKEGRTISEIVIDNVGDAVLIVGEATGSVTETTKEFGKDVGESVNNGVGWTWVIKVLKISKML
ncbi:hypothetical protein HDU76_004870 [Blyttiomyces sp. JEL0837]|nr:hypothetical protein HDU76_004870 [Blyttiomyces sp. JEL0837]